MSRCVLISVSGGVFQELIVQHRRTDVGPSSTGTTSNLTLHANGGSSRADVGEDEMIVVPNGDCALRRKFGCSIGADSGNER